MAAVEAHLGIIPHGYEENYRLLHTRDGITIVNRVGDEADINAFLEGIDEFDLLVRAGKRANHLIKYVEDDVTVRSMNHRDKDTGRFEATSVLEPLPSHPAFDPSADRQYFFEAHQFFNKEGKIWTPDSTRVHPFVALGTLASLSSLS